MILFEKLTVSFKNLINTTEKPYLILGLSGGPDSVFLFHFFCYLKKQNLINFIAAHLDHGWRSNSADDATWCKNLCKSHDIPYFEEHAKNFKDLIHHNGSLEETG
jgi:tRNA(Ile)-lysidine synthase